VRWVALNIILLTATHTKTASWVLRQHSLEEALNMKRLSPDLRWGGLMP